MNDGIESRNEERYLCQQFVLGETKKGKGKKSCGRRAMIDDNRTVNSMNLPPSSDQAAFFD